MVLKIIATQAANLLIRLVHHSHQKPNHQFSFKSKSSCPPKDRALVAIHEFLGAVKMAMKLSPSQTMSLSITICVYVFSVVFYFAHSNRV